MRIIWERLEGRSGHDVGRALLARLYRWETGSELPPILLTDRGKPYFGDGGLHFSVSHTKDHAFCCLSRQNVGIDAEETDRRVSMRLAGKILSDTEKARFRAAEDPHAALLRLWVLKEAYAKLLGKGLGDYLYATDFDPNDPRIQIIDGCYVAILEESTKGENCDVI